MFDKLRKNLQKDDFAVSAVIGTILMIAVTVVLGGVIYAAVGGFGQKDLGATTDPAVFRTSAIDTNSNGRTDVIQLTYFSGPATVVSTVNIDGAVPTWDHDSNTTTAEQPLCNLVKAGDSCRINVAQGNHQVVVIVSGKVALDTTVLVDE